MAGETVSMMAGIASFERGGALLLAGAELRVSEGLLLPAAGFIAMRVSGKLSGDIGSLDSTIEVAALLESRTGSVGFAGANSGALRLLSSIGFSSGNFGSANFGSANLGSERVGNESGLAMASVAALTG